MTSALESPWLKIPPLAGEVAALQAMLIPYGFELAQDGVVGQRGDLRYSIYLHAPSSFELPLEADVEVAIGIDGGPDYALAYISTWCALHGDLKRYRPNTDGWPHSMIEDFRRAVLPELLALGSSAELTEALLREDFPALRGGSRAGNATAAWSVATEAHLPHGFADAVVQYVEGQEWDKASAKELRWFAERFNMPVRVHEAGLVSRWRRRG